MNDREQQPFDAYLRDVQSHLVQVSPAEQERILAEIRAHLLDAATDADRSPDDIGHQQALIAALGPARRLGRALARVHRPWSARRLPLRLASLARALLATLATLAALLFCIIAVSVVPPPRPDTAVEVSGRVSSISAPHATDGDVVISLTDGRCFYINRANEVAHLDWHQMRAELPPGSPVQLTTVLPLHSRLFGTQLMCGPLAGVRGDKVVYMDPAVAAADWTTSEYTMFQSALVALAVALVCVAPELWGWWSRRRFAIAGRVQR